MNKKLFLFVLIAMFAIFGITAQETDYVEDPLANVGNILRSEVTEEKLDRTSTFNIAYFPPLDQATFIYTCSSAGFDA